MSPIDLNIEIDLIRHDFRGKDSYFLTIFPCAKYTHADFMLSKKNYLSYLENLKIKSYK